jgi:hypothetical protein
MEFSEIAPLPPPFHRAAADPEFLRQLARPGHHSAPCSQEQLGPQVLHELLDGG